MITAILSKAGYYLSLFVGIILASFILFHVVPTDPARIVLGPNASQEQVDKLRHELGLDDALHEQLLRYVKRSFAFDFGQSYVDSRDVFGAVAKSLVVTLVLIAEALLFVFVYLVTIVLTPIMNSVKRTTDMLDFLFSSQPIFFSGILIALLSISYYPFSSFSGDFSRFEDFLFMVPAAFVASLYPAAILSGILKKQLYNAFKSSYITAARSQGVSEISLLFRHALKNCLVPVLAALSNILPSMLTGAFIVEIIFSLPGIGTLLVNAILMRDLPMLECAIVLNGMFFVGLNFLFEALYPLIDRRIARGSNDAIS